MDNNVCQTCLNSSRSLNPVEKYKSFLWDVNITLEKDSNEQGGLCWECIAILNKFTKFKQQIRSVQEILISNNKITKTFSTLGECKKAIDFYIDFDVPLSVAGDDSVHDPAEDKESDCHVDGYESSSEEISVNNYRKSRDGPRNINGDKNANANYKDMYTSVIFSEEEIVRSREEKRNQPNFKKIPFKCDSCVLGFIKEDTYLMHIQQKHNQSVGTYMCNLCDVRFPTVGGLRRHRERHFTKHRCKLCKYEATYLSVILAHCRDKHSGDKCGIIHCRQCNFIAGTPEEMTEHKNKQHSIYCEECGEKFKGKNTLRAHTQRIHAKSRQFLCDFCHKAFKTKYRLEAHLISHNPSLAKSLSYCDICHVQYKNIYVYRNHLKNNANHSEKSYQCPDCHKKFVSKVYWQQHRDFYHMRKSQFKCLLCNKLFISNWRLKDHQQKHHGHTRPRDHGCDECDKKFYTLATLRAHQLTHSELRPFMCEDCGETFKQRPALYTHGRHVHQGHKRGKIKETPQIDSINLSNAQT